eukprot:2914411-Amphidinium_carterae.1
METYQSLDINGIPSSVDIPKIWHQWQPIPCCQFTIGASGASPPVLSFLKTGISGNPSSVVIPKFCHE